MAGFRHWHLDTAVGFDTRHSTAGVERVLDLVNRELVIARGSGNKRTSPRLCS